MKIGKDRWMRGVNTGWRLEGMKKSREYRESKMEYDINNDTTKIEVMIKLSRTSVFNN